MVLQTHAGLGPAVLPSLPCAQPNPVTILQRQSQHRAPVHSAGQLLLGVHIVDWGDYPANDNVRSHSMQMVSSNFCRAELFVKITIIN